MALELALSLVEEPVIAAGGVRDLDDLVMLRDLSVGGRSLGGVVVGREVTAGRFTIEEAAALLGAGTAITATWTAPQLRAALDEFIETRSDGDVGAEAFIEWIEKRS